MSAVRVLENAVEKLNAVQDKLDAISTLLAQPAALAALELQRKAAAHG